jgi:hypothetical protein
MALLLIDLSPVGGRDVIIAGGLVIGPAARVAGQGRDLGGRPAEGELQVDEVLREETGERG